MSALASKLKAYEDIYSEHLTDLANRTMANTLNLSPDFMKDRVQEDDPLIKKRIESEFFGSGPLTSLIDDNSVTEIMINAFNQICFERSGQIHHHEDHFSSEKTYRNFIERFSIENKINANSRRPTANGRWLGWRFHLVLPPLCKSTVLTLRRHRESTFTFEELEEVGWANTKEVTTLKNWVAEKRNLIIVGTTNTGKTSLLGAALNSLPQTERVLILEDTDELKIPNPASTKLLARDQGDDTTPPITLSNLVSESLRMRPDRIVLGEMRGPEAKDYLLALSTGHAGSFATLHASDPQQALIRLEFLVQIGAPMWSVLAIRQLIRNSLYGLVILENNNGKRALKGLYRIASLETSGFCLDRVY